MRRLFCSALVWLTVLASSAAELRFDFSQQAEGGTPEGFRNVTGGTGKAREWRIILDEVPSAFRSLTSPGQAVSKRAVLAQLGSEMIDEHFPMLIYDKETFGDFSITTKFKTQSGVLEQMAGIAFRFQDENNYYYIRASSLGSNIRFFKVVNGVRSQPIGSEITVPKGVWHELTVECKGNKIRCLLNGREIIPTLTDTSFLTGKVGFWTKSDSAVYFGDTTIVYTPRERLVDTLVQEAMARYPRLVGVRIYAPERRGGPVKLAASTETGVEIGSPASDVEAKVISDGQIYAGKQNRDMLVTMPLRDRNGDIVAAVRVTMQSFRGQTEQNAVARATPIVKEMERRLRAVTDFYE